MGRSEFVDYRVAVSYSMSSISNSSFKPALTLDRQSSHVGGLSPGLGPGPSSTELVIPVATNSVVNKVATASSSLYQNCIQLLINLKRVPDFESEFKLLFSSSSSSDPVTLALNLFRNGLSLIFLFNKLSSTVKQQDITVPTTAVKDELKAGQRAVAYFIMACKAQLGWTDNELFAIHELYGEDTNGVVKVIHSVTKLVNLLDQQGQLSSPTRLVTTECAIAPPSHGGQTSLDERGMVVREILDSERKYVQDLEVLQDYQRQLHQAEIITPDQIHHLFLNLNSLCDFQRRFLIGVETNASQTENNQRFGHLFKQMEDNFSVYEPYCANLTAAQDLAIHENQRLATLPGGLDPVSELAPLLIKPVQRICKYPLLLATLVKRTNPDSAYYSELQEGLAAIMRVTDRVNETTRKEDNRQAVIELGKRVEDWKGHDISSFGELLLQETFFVLKSDSEREYSVYLFERIILCCKESGKEPKNKQKSNSIIKKPANRKPTSLVLKGRIFVNNVTGAIAKLERGQHLLEVKWRGDLAEESFSIKCRTEDLQKQWQKQITKAVEEYNQRRRTNHLSSGRRSERSISSPLSAFPQTPISEYNPTPYGYPPTSFDDEYDDIPSESGRSTPNYTSHSHSRTRLGGLNNGPSSSSSAGAAGSGSGPGPGPGPAYWRTQSGSNASHSVPGLPQRATSHQSTGSDSPSLRSSASSKQLRNKPSTSSLARNRSYNSTSHINQHPQPSLPDHKRLSTSSNGTDRSSLTSSQSAVPVSLPLHLPPPPPPPPPHHHLRSTGLPLPPLPTTPSAVRIKVTYGDDTFVVVVLSNVSYSDLVEKVLKKIRLCGGDRARAGPESLMLKYKDEDGDEVSIRTQEDVLLALESARAVGTPGSAPQQSLALIAIVRS